VFQLHFSPAIISAIGSQMIEPIAEKGESNTTKAAGSSSRISGFVVRRARDCRWESCRGRWRGGAAVSARAGKKPVVIDL